MLLWFGYTHSTGFLCRTSSRDELQVAQQACVAKAMAAPLEAQEAEVAVSDERAAQPRVGVHLVTIQVSGGIVYEW